MPLPAHASGWPAYRMTLATSAGASVLTFWRPNDDEAQAHAERHKADLRAAGVAVYWCDVERVSA